MGMKAGFLRLNLKQNKLLHRNKRTVKAAVYNDCLKMKRRLSESSLFTKEKDYFHSFSLRFRAVVVRYSFSTLVYTLKSR